MMSSAKLDEVLSAQKPSSNKTGLGYDVSSNPSSSMASGSRIVFVPQSEKGNKDMKFKTDLANSKSFVRPHVCHHYGVSRHIALSCILKSKCSDSHRFPLKDRYLCLESY